MKLKKLEITGFKSFMDKTRVVFPPGTTAIVGPNGCGKSNVVDALRWVMGEQNVRKLRGKTSEDIIFAGAANNAPMNMAEVSLTIDNQDGSVVGPFNEYSEITVTRRILRSGESGYFINRQPARLKDIQTLFLGSGTGKNAFAVIQQGNIGALTDATPDERRVFIEEAADVTKYKARKKETESKIKGTRENLDRVGDILVELENQLSTLRRQAKKAILFKDLQKSIRDLDITLAGVEFVTLGEKAQSLVSTAAKTKEQITTATTRRSALESAMDRLKLHSQETNDAIEAHNRRIYELKRVADRDESQIAHLRETAQKRLKEVEEETALLGEAQLRQKELKAEIQELKETHGGADESVTLLERKIEEAQNACSKARRELTELESQSHKDSILRMELVAKEASVRHIFTTAEKNLENATRKLKRRDEDLAHAKSKLGTAKSDKQSADAEMAELKGETTELREHLDDLRDALRSREIQINTLDETIRTEALKESRLKATYDTIHAMVHNLEGYGDGVKEAMAQLDDLGSITHEVVADLIQVEKGFETAVETALGQSLTHVVVDSTPRALDSAQAMIRETKARCGFLPQDDSGPQPFAGETPQGCTPLAQVANLDTQLPKAFHALASRLFVAETLDEAISAHQTSQEPIAIATPDGQLVDFSGAVIAGNQGESTSLLARRTQMAETEEELTRLQERTSKLINERELLSKEVTREKEGLRQAESELSVLLRDRSEKERTCLLADEAVKQSLRHLEVMELESQQLEGELQDLEEAMEQGQKKLLAVQKELEAVTMEEEKAREGLAEAREALAAAEQVVMEQKLELAREEAKHESHRATLRRLDGFLKEGTEAILRLETGIEKKRGESAASTQKATELEHGLEASFDAIAKEEEALGRTRTRLARLDVDFKEKEAEFKELSTLAQELSEALRKAEVELASVITRGEELKARVQEQYRTPIEELAEAFAREIETVTSGEADQKGMAQELSNLKNRLRRLGEVNTAAVTQYEEVSQRHTFLTEQQSDLNTSLEDLEAIIRKINRITQERFTETFHRINEKLEEIFPRLFEGGSARLVLTDPSAPLTTGVELMIQPPGKKQARLSLLSGGEKALSAIAFVFSIFLLKPSSFCVMDEIDAPLDDANVVRFNNLLTHIAEQSQILVITHNKITMEHADILLGVTMEKKGVSKVVAVNLTGKENPLVFEGAESA